MSLWKNPDGESGSLGGESPVIGSSSESQPAFRRDEGEESQMANIGKSITIKGDVIGDEDTVIEGKVEGRIELKNHHLTVGPNGDVQGEISAKQVTVVGVVAGNVVSTERIELRESGRVDGDLMTPKLLVQEGAQINGTIKMQTPATGALGMPPKRPEKAPTAAAS